MAGKLFGAMLMLHAQKVFVLMMRAHRTNITKLTHAKFIFI